MLHVIFNIKFQSSAKTRAKKKKKKCRPYLVLKIFRERLVNNNNLNVFSTANKLLIVIMRNLFEFQSKICEISLQKRVGSPLVSNSLSIFLSPRVQVFFWHVTNTLLWSVPSNVEHTSSRFNLARCVRWSLEFYRKVLNIISMATLKLRNI